MPDDTADTTSADPVGDAESAAETLHDLIAYLAHQSATAATRDPPSAEELADLTGRIAVPSHRRGYQQGVFVTAEGALDRVVEANGYCDWAAVAALHADRYAPHDPSDDDGDGSPDHEQEPEREVATDGGVETAPKATLDVGPDTDADADGGRSGSGSPADLAVRYVRATHHAHRSGDGTPHADLVAHLLFDCGCDPAHADDGIRLAVEAGRLHCPDAPNHYRPVTGHDDD